MTKFLTRLALMCAVLVTSSQSGTVAAASYTEGTWAVAARAGISPSVFSKKARITYTGLDSGAPLPASTTDTILDTTTGVAQYSDDFAFSDVYSLPFATGFDVGYFVCDNWEIFLGFGYEHACHKKFNVRGKADGNDPDNFLDDGVTATWNVRDLNSYTFTLGSRYYLECLSLFDGMLPFVGAKLGVKSCTSCNGNEDITTTFDDGTPPIALARSASNDCASFAGGVQWGFDWMLDDCYALTFMSEVVGTSGKLFKSGRQLGAVDTNGDRTFTNVSRNRTVLSFPVTLGLRITF